MTDEELTRIIDETIHRTVNETVNETVYKLSTKRLLKDENKTGIEKSKSY